MDSRPNSKRWWLTLPNSKRELIYCIRLGWLGRLTRRYVKVEILGISPHSYMNSCVTRDCPLPPKTRRRVTSLAESHWWIYSLWYQVKSLGSKTFATSSFGSFGCWCVCSFVSFIFFFSFCCCSWDGGRRPDGRTRGSHKSPARARPSGTCEPTSSTPLVTFYCTRAPVVRLKRLLASFFYTKSSTAYQQSQTTVQYIECLKTRAARYLSWPSRLVRSRRKRIESPLPH